MRGGRKIDDEQVVQLGEGGVAQGAQERQLFGARERGDLLGVEPGGAEQIEGGGGAFLEGGEIVAESGGGVGPPDGEPLPGHHGRGPGDGTEHGSEAVTPVAAQQQYSLTVTRGGERGGSGNSRTTAAAGARDQDGAHEGER